MVAKIKFSDYFQYPDTFSYPSLKAFQVLQGVLANWLSLFPGYTTWSNHLVVQGVHTMISFCPLQYNTGKSYSKIFSTDLTTLVLMKSGVKAEYTELLELVYFISAGNQNTLVLILGSFNHPSISKSLGAFSTDPQLYGSKN